MSHVLVSAPHIQRKYVNNMTTVGNGAHLVNNRLVAIETTTGIALIFDQLEWELHRHQARRILRIDLLQHKVIFVRTHSLRLHHFGASIKIVGTFNRERPEMITIHTSRDNARLVLELLR